MRHLASLSLLLLAAVSCGTVKGDADAGNDVDADNSDGGGTVVDANPRGTASVNVHTDDGEHAPISGATAIFVDPDGTEVGQVLTDAEGRASADVLPGASVTVAVVRTDGASLRTVVGIEPGDDIVLGARRTQSPSAGTMRFEWPLYPSAAAAATYYVYTQCGEAYAGTATLLSVTFYEHCVPTNVELLVVAYLNGYVAYRTASIPFSANGMPPPLAGGWTALGTGTVSFTGITPALQEIEVMYRNVAGAGTYFRSSDYFTEAGGATGSVMPMRAPGFGGATDVTLVIESDAGHRLQLQVRRVAGSAASFPIEVAPSLLPWVGDTAVDLEARSVSAIVLDSGTWDLTRFRLEWERAVGDDQYYYDWVTYAPGGTTGLTLAELPAGLAAFGPQASDGVYAETTLVEVDTLTEAQVRQLPDEVFGDEFCDRWYGYYGQSWRYFQAPPFTARYSGVPQGD